jgi:hypothetical protein
MYPVMMLLNHLICPLKGSFVSDAMHLKATFIMVAFRFVWRRNSVVSRRHRNKIYSSVVEGVAKVATTSRAWESYLPLASEASPRLAVDNTTSICNSKFRGLGNGPFHPHE